MTDGIRWAQKLNVDKLEQIKQRSGLTELHGDDGGPFRRVVSARDGAELGETRILVGDGPVAKVVYHALQVEFIGLDSHMIFAFTPSGSPIPHWTFDSVLNAPIYAFHLDMLPRVDLGSHRLYMDHVYAELNDTFKAGSTHEGVSPAELAPRQRAIMSPWMFAYRVTAEQYPNIEQYVQRYLDRWYDMLENGLPQDVLESIADTDLAARDTANRNIIFNREVDPVWDMITPLIGDQQSELMRAQLATNEVVESIPDDFKIPVRA
jgi:hypothetical protein